MLGGVVECCAKPLGIVLAGGAGSRLGGAKAMAMLRGRPLAEWVAGALAEAVGEVAIVAKASTDLPVFAPEIAVWREPDEPQHPLAGIVWALARAEGRAVLVCAVDLPFVDAAALRGLCEASPEAPVVIAAGQPLLGRYAPSAADALAAAVTEGGPVRETVAALGAVEVALTGSERVLFNVNTPSDLTRAQAMVVGAAGADRGGAAPG
jgi:molybdopterin-guanine dinucleotide biosynthesis protein A